MFADNSSAEVALALALIKWKNKSNAAVSVQEFIKQIAPSSNQEPSGELQVENEENVIEVSIKHEQEEMDVLQIDELPEEKPIKLTKFVDFTFANDATIKALLESLKRALPDEDISLSDDSVGEFVQKFMRLIAVDEYASVTNELVELLLKINVSPRSKIISRLLKSIISKDPEIITLQLMILIGAYLKCYIETHIKPAGSFTTSRHAYVKAYLSKIQKVVYPSLTQGLSPIGINQFTDFIAELIKLLNYKSFKSSYNATFYILQLFIQSSLLIINDVHLLKIFKSLNLQWIHKRWTGQEKTYNFIK